MTQKDKLRESFLALVSIKSTANNIINYCSEAANYAQEIKLIEIKDFTNIPLDVCLKRDNKRENVIRGIFKFKRNQ